MGGDEGCCRVNGVGDTKRTVQLRLMMKGACHPPGHCKFSNNSMTSDSGD